MCARLSKEATPMLVPTIMWFVSPPSSLMAIGVVRAHAPTAILSRQQRVLVQKRKISFGMMNPDSVVLPSFVSTPGH